jgi:hypothetical protein
VIVVALLVGNAAQAAVGEEVPVLSDSHVEEGTDPGPYNSDPPTSGRHYASEFVAGFFEESDLASLPAYPEGYLVHNLEHGYVIFWYNCAVLDEAGCAQLKAGIRGVMDEFDGVKLIAFPRATLRVPLAMTSWGRLQEFETFDAEGARRFVRANRYRAPEPDAP